MENFQNVPLDSDMVTNEFNPERFVASGGIRFANYIIDIIFFYVLMFLLGVLAGVFGISIPDDELFLRLIGIPLLFVYYFVFEASLGKTPAKFITRSRVVNESGERPGAATIAGRSLSRLVPFEAFSFLGNSARGWHDTWSGTWVVDERKIIPA